jgi:hypothetical protein
MKSGPATASRWRPLYVALFAWAWAACSGKNTVAIDVETAGAGGAALSVGRAGSANGGISAAGGADESSGAPAGGPGGVTAVEAAGAAGDGDATQASGAGNVVVCVTDADCGSPIPCVAAFCRAGTCQSSNLFRGSSAERDVPADCHAEQCDGQGKLEHVLDFGNVPASSNPCSVTACDNLGNPSSQPSAAGVACQSAQGGRMCDGAGQCVECLTSLDCSVGTCQAHSCSPASCSNGQLDGSETDVDCGGTCPACADKQRCKIDQDCASDDCDALELVCLPASCIDQKQDGSETDVDCGGADCAGCYIYLKCRVNADCATQQCDPVMQQCVGNACTDHRQDGRETDIDCGGADDCVGCKAGQKCSAAFDCVPGLGCNDAVTPPVCQRL